VQIPRHAGGQPSTYLQPPLGGAESAGISTLDATPLFAFGHGRSYTTFALDSLWISDAEIATDGELTVSVRLTNTGSRAGDEVVQLYLKFPDVPGAPLRALRGFQRVHLEPGASQKVEFKLNPRDLSMVNDLGDIIVAQGKYTVSIGGGQPGTGAPSVIGNFDVNGKLMLPE